ncbi:MAG: hypothetical protein IBX69_04380 [Anaerolineales bacterium]|nr:hypothetical protein [Anaerolineales bacterium]
MDELISTKTSTASFPLSGALAGTGSTIVFAAIHHALISDIWFSLVPMLVAGALCGLCLAWSFGRLFRPPSIASWLFYNLVYVALFFLLGIASLIFLEPVTTIAELVAANEAPHELIRQALPLTLGFTITAAALISFLWGRNPLDVAAVLLTCIVLVSLLGLNVSVLGLVQLTSGSFSLVAMLFGLIVALNVAYLALFLLIERL